MSPVIDHLRALGRDATAAEIARALGLRIEEVYMQLVRAHDREQARICVSQQGHESQRVRTWGAL